MPRSILWLLLLCVLAASPAWAEVRIITATGEYRMGDNDTRTDAKRLALRDAKRNALEKAGTYLESISEIKHLELSRDEIRTYAAGIVEVTEQSTKSTMEGETTVVRIDVKVKIDTDVVAHQIDVLRRNESATIELANLREERNKLRQALDDKNREMAALKSKSAIEAAAQQRQEILTRADVNDLLAQARVAFGTAEGSGRLPGTTTTEERERTKALLNQILALDPSHPKAHAFMGSVLFHENDLEGAMKEYRTFLRLDPTQPGGHVGLASVLGQQGDLEGAIAELRLALSIDPGLALAHFNMGTALARKGLRAEAAQEYRKFLKLVKDAPANRPLIESANAILGDLERKP